MNNIAEGQYVMYKGKPLVRQGQQILYGFMEDKYILFLGIMSTKKVGDADVPDEILIQIQSTADKKVVKFGKKNGLYEAFEYGIAWLDTELRKG